ncbi:MAG: hypothetical protein M0Q92_15430 [Methanoregula sp.]|jgi:hypothetical protein|nr:hypothetical protein [Methanoregula sp.]
MTLERMIANDFALDNETRFRNANPWSIALRNMVLPILILASWSRLWQGGMPLSWQPSCSGRGSTPGSSRPPATLDPGASRQCSVNGYG